MEYQKMLPTNSDKSKEERTLSAEEKGITKVTKGGVTQTKDSAVKSFLNKFMAEDIDDIKEHVLFDVIIPSIKQMIFDGFTGSLEASLFGSNRRSNIKRSSGKSYVSYSGMSNNSNYRSNGSKPAEHNDYRNFAFQSRGDAEEVLSQMQDIIEDYEEGVSIDDFYSMIGKTGSYTDRKYGWKDLRSASVERSRDGYVIKLPPATTL